MQAVAESRRPKPKAADDSERSFFADLQVHPEPTPNATFSTAAVASLFRANLGKYRLERISNQGYRGWFFRYNVRMSMQSNAQDTSHNAELVLIDLVRNQSPTERLRMALSATRRVAQQCKRAIIRANPGISEDEVSLRFIELNYGEKLADEVRKRLTVGRRS